MKKKSFLALVTGLFGVFYILNPTAGIFELIPDNIPFIGNMDEAAAVFLIVGCLRYFGIDVTRKYSKEKNMAKQSQNNNS